ncbi:ATP-binding protein [Sphingobacterium siyangense]|uniref:ATP-binding protein n=1 Tax=Sphingobacterium siyangense TaxID=459529 RepID=UPI001965A687|nr:ATP-binding protein [Sphingobacterium siyangense]QRY55934.1 hypothetical protein JVX97_18115 [Sphingobacterium siyangense]
MGSLIVKKVKYSGENYSYESPELKKGINIILGDNGSGKSTFSYFIEYALGGKVKPFDNDDEESRYSLILDDTNNYVQIDILIDDIPYSLKRFIGKQDVFVSDGTTTESYPISRQSAPFIFSDWLLGKLKIPVFEIYLGAAHWFFNFNDLFRLLNYDQNTEPRKIYKSPVAENFIADSIIIRKSIFEILLGISSIEYFDKLEKLKVATKKRDVAKALFQNYESIHEKPEDSESLSQRQSEIKAEIDKLEQDRQAYQIRETTVDDKIGELAGIQSILVNLELKTSKERIMLKSLENEQIKVDHVHRNLRDEIEQIQKIIFTHERLDLFSMEVCPFCMNKKEIAKGVCICGSKFKEDDYEKFVYNASEYKDILSHRQKSIEAIAQAKDDYAQDIREVTKKIEKNSKLIDEYTAKLKMVIETAQFAGSTTVIDDYNNRILKLKEQSLKLDYALRTSKEWKRLSDDLDDKIAKLKTAQSDYMKTKNKYDLNNAATIKAFNTVYSKLLAKSSYKSTEAHIDEDYMPFIDNREYKANSSDVPKRLMYYFTILSLAMKLPSVKHPRFLLIDTPEDSGIDTDHLNQNLELLRDALIMGKQSDGTFKDFQVILTTGYGKFPPSFEKYVLEKFSEKDGNFILKPKTPGISNP